MSVDQSSSLLHRAVGFCAFWAAIAIPLRAFGVAIEQGALGLSLIAALSLFFARADVRALVKSAVLSSTGKGAIAIFAAFAITVPFSFAPMGSLEIGGRTGLFLLAAVLVWATIKSTPSSHALVWKSLIVTALVCGGIAILSLAGLDTLTKFLKFGAEGRIRPDLQFKAFATSCMCLLPVVAWAGRKLGGQWRWWGYAFAPLALSVMVLTYNRSALAGVIAMTVVGLILLILAQRRHAMALLATAIGVATSIIAWIGSRESEILEIIAQRSSQAANSASYLPEWLIDPHRQVIWKFAFERFLDHPLVGNGIDQINRLPGSHTLIPNLSKGAYVVPSHPHNWMLEILAEAGLIGLGAIILVLALVAWRLARNYIRTDDDADLASLVLMAGFWVSALFNFSIWASWWQLTFFILFALIAATRPNQTLPRSDASPM